MPVKWMSREKCMALLAKAVYGRLATCGEDGQPYITPMNLVVYQDRIYFHTGFQGRKLNNLRGRSKACFEVSESGKMYAPLMGRDFTMRFWSVVVFGEARELKDRELKFTVMNLFMDKYAKGYEYKQLTLEDMDIVNVVEMSIQEMSGKVSVDPEKV